MDEDDHRIIFASLDFCRRNQPALNVKPFVRPLDAFGVAPVHLQASVVLSELAPFAERASENFRRRVVSAANSRCELAIFGDSEVGKIAESVKGFRSFPHCAYRVVCQAQLRNSTATTSILSYQNPR